MGGWCSSSSCSSSKTVEGRKTQVGGLWLDGGRSPAELVLVVVMMIIDDYGDGDGDDDDDDLIDALYVFFVELPGIPAKSWAGSGGGGGRLKIER